MRPIHPAIVHFPIALLTLSVIADLFGYIYDGDSLRGAGWWSLLGAAVGGALAVVAGLYDMNREKIEHAAHERVHTHMKVGFTVLAVVAALTIWRWMFYVNPGGAVSIIYLVVAFLALGLTMFQGYLGGELVFADGVGVAPTGQDTEPPEKAHEGDAKGAKDESGQHDMKDMENMKDMNNMKDTENMKDMKNMRSMYGNLAINMAINLVIMYLVMFAMIYRWGEFVQNINFFYMALMMWAPMGALMLLFMGMMYKNKTLNIIIYASSVLIFVLAFIGIRNQSLVGDKQFLRSMIPHHSGALVMCREASISDSQIKELCFGPNGIVESQEREIIQMTNLLESK